MHHHQIRTSSNVVLLFLHLKSFTGKFMRWTYIYCETVAIFFNYILFTLKAYLTQSVTPATRPAVIFILLFGLHIESLSSAVASFKCWLKSYPNSLTAY